MMTLRNKIYFVHDGKAAYPELAAYKTFFESEYDSEEVNQEQAAIKPDIADSVCWHMMGFYPKRLPARLVIHDYRSLSVGKMREFKDAMKRWGNARPDIRIFQNTAMQKAMGFSDGVPTILLPMGVPDFVSAYRSMPRSEANGDYVYIGAMSAERKSHMMIDSFLKRFGGSKSLLLYGNPEAYLVETYKEHANIRFAGTLPQRELFARLTEAGACVCYFPNHYPHLLQTPTKMLEYAALGLRIIANDQALSVATAQQYGIQCHWGTSDDMFAGAPDTTDWPDNAALDPAAFLWPAVIGNSGIADVIAARLTQRLSA